MLITKKVNIKVVKSNIVYYKSIGFVNIKINDIIDVDVNMLRKGCAIKVDVSCDICEKEKNIFLQKYYKNLENGGIYTCRKCAHIKTRKTVKERYGVDSITQLEVIKNKIKHTTLKNYGVENVSQSELIKSKKCETMQKNYGVSYVLQSKELSDKIKKTKNEIYGNPEYRNYEQCKKTLMNNYNVFNPSQSDIIKDKKKKSSLIKYGVEFPFQSELIKNNIKTTNLIKYGVEHPSKVEEIKLKTKQTNVIKYGVEFPLQNKKIFDKVQKTSFKIKQYKKTDLYYQASYEKDFLDNYYDKIKITKIAPILYTFNNKIKYYHPDFYIQKLNLIIEIKSDYTYNKEIDKNLAKQKACLEQGYDFIFIINKNYKVFELKIM